MLKDTVKKQMIEAMKAKQAVTKEILRVALGEIQTAEARSGKDADDNESAAIIRKLIKSNNETLESRPDAESAAKLSEEIKILEALLPQTLSVEEITNALAPVSDQITAAGNDGQATGVAMKHLKSTGAQVVGKDVNQAVRQMRN